MSARCSAATSQMMAATHTDLESQHTRLPAFDEGKELMPPSSYSSWQDYNDRLGGLDVNLEFGSFRFWNDQANRYERTSVREQGFENYVPCHGSCLDGNGDVLFELHPGCAEHREALDAAVHAVLVDVAGRVLGVRRVLVA